MKQIHAVVLAAVAVFLCTSTNVGSAAVERSAVKKKKAIVTTITAKPCRRNLSVQEVEERGLYKTMEALMYRMCIQEVPFFLALHKGFYMDKRLDKGDTLVLSKRVIQKLLETAADRAGEKELMVSPVTNIDSMVIFRARGRKVKPGTCNIIVFARPDAYEIPKTGAKIRVPAKIKGTIVFNAHSNQMTVTIFSKEVKLELPGYAKLLSFGLIGDMDIRYAELSPIGSAYEARLLYATKEKEVTKKGWSLNITECNKIRPYSR